MTNIHTHHYVNTNALFGYGWCKHFPNPHRHVKHCSSKNSNSIYQKSTWTLLQRHQAVTQNKKPLMYIPDQICHNPKGSLFKNWEMCCTLNPSDLKAEKAANLASSALSRTILRAPFLIFLATPSCTRLCAKPANTHISELVRIKRSIKP